MTRQELKPKKSITRTKRNEKLIMLRKTMTSVAVRRFATAITALALSLSGLVFSPAQANVPVNGSYSCATGEKDGPAPSYTISAGGVSGGVSCTGAVVIPPGVTSIESWGFYSAQNITSVNIPSTVTSIGVQAFYDALELTNISIPAGVTSIGDSAFFNTSSLAFFTVDPANPNFRSIDGVLFNKNATTLLHYPVKSSTTSYSIPVGVTTIANNAFRGAGSLTSISIPASVVSFGADTFVDTSSLTSFTVAPTNANFSSIDGVLFNKNATTLLSFPFKSSATSYSIPAGVTTIADNAFRKATQLTSVTLPAGVTSIGASAFSEAYALTSINIPAGVTSIGSGAFGQTAITSINIPEGVTRIENSTFQYARQLISVTIPASVTSIGEDAFFGNVSMTSITFAPGSQLTSIGLRAFTSSVIKAITIPANVTSIGNRAFQDTVRLETVKFEPGSKLTTIGELAFYEAKVLTNISIPASVTTIGRQAFATAPKLTEYFFLGNAPATLHAEAFTGVAATAKGYTRTGATGFGSGSTWNGLAIVVGFYENVSFNSKGGSAVTNQDAYSKITQSTAPTRAGYTFAGWTATDGGETTVTFPYAPSEFVGITLYAKWTPNTYIVNWNSRGGTAVSRGSFVTEGSIATGPTAPTRSGYTFAGWTATNGGSTIVTFPHKPGVIENISLYAKWTLNSYTVSWDSNGGTAVPNGSFVTDGEISSAPVTPTLVDHFFLGWSATDGGSVVSFPYAPGVVQNITLYAKWLNVPPYEPVLNTYPTISGKAIQNTFLVATTGTWSALPEAVKTVQWYRCEKPVIAGVAEFTEIQDCKRIPGATKPNYKIGLADQSKYLTVLTEAKNKVGSTESTAKSVLVPNVAIPVMKSAPKITGPVVKGSVLDLGTGTWYANPMPVTTKQWYRCENPVPAGISELIESVNCVKIPGASKDEYKTVTADQAKHLTALVTSKNSQGIVTESAKSVRVKGIKPTAKSSPKISGAKVAGGLLQATNGTWSAIPEATTSLAWYRCATAVTAGATAITRSMGCTKISGATTPTYSVAVADQGKHLTVLVNAKNTDGKASSMAASIFIKVPEVKPTSKSLPKISGSTNVGSELRATNGTWSAVPVATTSLVWYRCATAVTAGVTPITSSMGCKKISGATGSKYAVAVADQGKYLTVLVTAKNSKGNALSTAKSVFIKVPKSSP